MLETLLINFSLFGCLIWWLILCLPWQAWRTQEVLNSKQGRDPDLSQLTVLIPARNEAEHIHQTLSALKQQGQNLTTVLIDDESSDNTTHYAKQTALPQLKIIYNNSPPPNGWSGKLWALEQGFQHIETRYTLLLDADITLQPGFIAALMDKMQQQKLDLVSVMVSLSMRSFWEKLLVPAFIYFFKLLYPFKLANSSKSKLGAAAGGCILIKTAALKQIGGFQAIKDALIDDCTLAKKIKQAGFKTWIGLTNSAFSHRPYHSLSDIWQTVARTAFTQLRYSTTLLLLCTVMLLSLFCLPIMSLALTTSLSIKLFFMSGLVIMLGCYLPTLYFYKRHPAWSLLMPLIATLYLLMTWTSAIRYWRGKRSEWKDRVYVRD